ncbi:MAG: dienelactone hydrolase family protein [Chloroflexi bacterium]|nr:dienelactone hydrolase family protein [Chloroflexota bacterium]
MYEGLLAETVNFTGDNGDLIGGFLARPLGAGPFPSVIVIHEVFGLVEHIKDLALRFAARGYIALAPDLHHRDGPGSVDDIAAAVRAAGGAPDARVLGDLTGAAAYLRSLAYANGKVGVIGYCSGGRQSYLAACNIPSLNAAVDCYGGRVVAGPEQLNARQPVAPIDMTANMQVPLLGLFGEEDGNPSPAMVATMEDELRKHHKTFEFHIYKNAGHGFFADYRPSYRVEAANDAWMKIFAWYEKYLT